MADAAEVRSLPARLSTPAAIEVLPTAVTAFVGRTLRGPLDQPLMVASFAEFQRLFGSLWQPSMLSYAVSQFFEHGGRSAIIVRVANGARAASIALPGPAGVLRLRGLNPGTREFLRAAVDYDGIAAQDTDCFNLVVQRLQSAGTEQIEDQEIFRRLTVRPGAKFHVADALGTSRLVRVEGAVASQRPSCTASTNPGVMAAYVASLADGDDGAQISDYDLIGSADRHTGLFALTASSARFNLLCIPPLARERDVGLAVWLVAARICREQQALLIVDPPRAWHSPEAALRALPGWAFNSADACMFFPRISAHDRLLGRSEDFAPCGAVAGMFAAADARWPICSAALADEPLIRAPAQLTVAVSQSQREHLASLGINTLRAVRAPTDERVLEPRTLVPDLAARTDLRYLAVRRLAHCIVRSVTQGTRWVALEAPGDGLWQRLRAQVEAFLESLAQHGALVGERVEDSYFVVCDGRLNAAEARPAAEVRLVFGFAPMRPGDFQTWLVTQRAAGSSARAVSVNRAMTQGRRAEVEIETAILQGLPI